MNSRWMWLVVCFLVIVAPAPGRDSKKVAEFKKGELHVTQNGKVCVMALEGGTIKVMHMTIQGKPAEARIIDLQYAGKGGTGRAFITFDATNGPKGEYSVINLKVLTGQGGTSAFSAQKGTCQLSLKQCDEKGIQGSASFTGGMDDGRGGKGSPLSDMTFSAAP